MTERPVVMRRSVPWVIAALVLVGTACVGLGVAAVGTFLRVPLCLGSGSECAHVQPVWETGGKTLDVVGSVVFIGAPAIAGVVAWRLQRRRRRDEERSRVTA